MVARLVGLALLLVAVAAAVHRLAPADLVALPERPYPGYGTPAVRTESLRYPRHATAASRHATQAIVLTAGRILAQGAPDEVFTSALWRDVFAVESERVRTSTGQSAFVFTRRAATSAPLQTEVDAR
jgi:hypothetical protein